MEDHTGKYPDLINYMTQVRSKGSEEDRRFYLAGTVRRGETRWMLLAW